MVTLRIPFGLFRDTLLNVKADEIREKFALACVSRRWRDVALSSALLWSTFRIVSHRNAVSLPFLLARSGDAQLDITLDFTGPAAPTAMQQNVVRRLVPLPHVTRLQSLALHFDTNTSASAVEPLLNAGLVFPTLRHLQIVVELTTLYISIAALQLRVLELEQAQPTDWELLLVPSLEVLHCRYVADATVLVRVFAMCPCLQDVELVSTGPAAEEFPSELSPPRALRSLTLKSANTDDDIADLLRLVADAHVVAATINVAVSNGQPSSVLTSIVTSIYAGLSNMPWSLEICDKHNFTVRSDSDTGPLLALRAMHPGLLASEGSMALPRLGLPH